MRKAGIIFASIACVALSGSAAAESAAKAPTKILDEAIACRAVSDPTQRLACFDEAIGKIEGAKAKREIVVLDREEVKKTERSLFGFSLPKLDLFGGGDGENKGSEKQDQPVGEIESTITSVASAGYGKWVLGLEDGSVWQTTEMNTSIEPRKGQPIRIERAALGSFRASIDGQKLLRAKRVG